MHMNFSCTLVLSCTNVKGRPSWGPCSSGLCSLLTVRGHLWIMHLSVTDSDPLDEEVEVAARGFQNTQQRFPSLLFWGGYAETC